MSDLLAAAEAWIAGDPDPETRAELRALLASGDRAELADRMDGSLPFGTAGLRGVVAAGSNRMNRAVVIRATRGLADHLLATTGPDRGPVVVGRDARHSSPAFLEDTVAVLAAAGLDVVLLPGAVPTPVVAFAALEVEAVAAVVITASHNPPADNGYKVYAGNGVQIVPPTDVEIAAAIGRVGAAVTVPRVEDPFHDPRVRVVADMPDRYLEALSATLPVVAGDRSLRIVYTPLHGVGGRLAVAAPERFGFRCLHPVARQFAPDGAFPTVRSPNPEEPGTLELALELAAAVDADLVLANDPDADRLAVAVPDGGGFRVLTGNQVGALLADFLLEHTVSERPILVNTVVSSPVLEAIAREAGAIYARTLTGFKWIWNAVLDLEAADRGRFLFGYEEAIGYTVWPRVRDKDGIATAVVFAELAAVAAAAGQTVWDRLEALERRHGLWVSHQESFLRPGREGHEEIAAAMARLGREVPARLGPRAVTGAVDYRLGAEGRPRWLPAAPLVEYDLLGEGKARIRPSGTEPKLKIYVDLRGELGSGEDRWSRERALLAEAAAVARDLARFAGVV